MGRGHEQGELFTVSRAHLLGWKSEKRMGDMRGRERMCGVIDGRIGGLHCNLYIPRFIVS